MFIARLENGHLFNVQNYTRNELHQLKNKLQFFCPQCLKKVHLKIGSIKRPHFAHKSNSNCKSESFGEGYLHKSGKHLLYKWLKTQGLNVNLEKYIHEINRTSDLFLILNRRKIVIEYQCSIINKLDLNKRMKDYKSHHYEQIWILGANLFQRLGSQLFKINQFIKQFIHQFNEKLTPKLYFFCPKNKKFLIVEHIYQISPTIAYGQFHFYDLTSLTLLDLFKNSPLRIERLKNIWFREKKKFRLHRNKALINRKDWRHFLYNNNMHESFLPSYIHIPTHYNFLMKEPTWYWQGKLVISIIEKKRYFTLSHCIHYLQNIVIHSLPLMKQMQNPVKLYLDMLTRLNIIRSVPSRRFHKVIRPRKRAHIEEMVNEDYDLLKRMLIFL